MSDERHGTTEELLAVRDGEGSAWVKAHVEVCAACATELYRLEQVRAQLRALSAFAPPRDRWSVVVERARRERRQRRFSGAAGLAAAAALGGLLLVAVQGTRPDALQAETTLRSAMARSQAMEQVLKGVDPDARALGGDAAGVVVDLQQRLEAIDARLGDPSTWGSEPGRQAQLWNERAGLLSALVDVHTTHVAYAGL
jgi:anti-sigma factor RsiW